MTQIVPIAAARRVIAPRVPYPIAHARVAEHLGPHPRLAHLVGATPSRVNIPVNRVSLQLAFPGGQIEAR